MAEYLLEDTRCTSRTELADAMARHWEGAHTHLARGYIGRWLEEDLKDYSAKIELDRLGDKYEYVAVVLALFVQKYGSDKTAQLCGVDLTIDSLRDYFAHCRDPDGKPEDRAYRIAGLIYECNLLSEAAVFPDQAAAQELAETWRREMEDYLRTLGEMLSYHDVWAEPVVSIRNVILKDPQDNMALAEAFLTNTAIPEHLHTDYYLPGHVEILASLLESENFGSPNLGPPVAELPQADIAMREAWFAQMAENGEDTLGRRTQLRLLHDFALGKHGERLLMGKLDEVKRAEASTGRTTGIGVMLSKLEPKVQAGLFAAGVFAPGLMLVPDGMATGAAFALYIALILTIGLTPFRARKFGTGAKMAIGFVVLSMAGVVFPYGSEWDGMPVSTLLVLTGLAAASGWYREKLLAARRAHEASAAEQSAGRPPSSNTTDRMSLSQVRGELVAQVDPRTGMGVSRSTPQASQLVDSPAVPSAVAANHGDGRSVSFLGSNYASDGTRTTEITDGLSVDSKGGYNVRVADGLTLHSDGRRTVEITDGLRIRSDGQKSVDVLGQTVSWGGEEGKKSWFDPKEETDWFGNKKKKGWFD